VLQNANSNKKGYCCTTFAQDPNSRQKWIDAAGIPSRLKTFKISFTM